MRKVVIKSSAGPVLPTSPTKSVRCTSCGEWVRDLEAAVASCPACSFTTARCDDPDCTGTVGVMRSIRAHFAWWAGRGHQAGGHQRALAERVREVILEWRKTWAPRKGRR